MTTAVSANRLELLQIADAVARDKTIDRDIVLEAMEEAIQKAARSRYGAENEIKAHIDRKTGAIKLYRVLEVVENVENHATQISLEDARVNKEDAQIGDMLADELPPIDFGRVAAQTAKQVIVQKVRDAERARQYEEYKDRVGEIISGVVKRVEYGNAIVDIGHAEAIIRRDQMIPREHIRNGERVRAYIMDVRREPRGPQVFLSRTHPEFMARLFAQEVPEIYDGVIEIKAVSRDPGSRAKIAVYSTDPSIDPVGACVGMRGSRVQAVVNELQGEKIDIIQWSPDIATFIVSALAPANVSKVVVDEDKQRIEVVVPEDQLSLAIGRRGQNVRLASQLVDWQVDILTEADESERRQAEYKQRADLFREALDVDDTLALLLVSEGFSTLEEVAYVAPEEFAGIEGFDEELVEELQNRAREALTAREQEAEVRRKELGVEDELAALEGLNGPMLVTLGEAGIKTLDDLGDLSADELISKEDGILRDYDLSEDAANEIIMAARAHWFEDEDQNEDRDETADAEGANVDSDSVASTDGSKAE
ncbi:transcription termination factor NusA [Luteithermobacter gelatinilyticus]|uniref:transcription termination factor NusA n=1 Tax=Luteithermobacter gelatinilyticus TaxID=2582913 RepID=UPI001105AC75|nr:transcription termination factor NusA [Luteithermobacter gelatinilyticus]